MPAGKGTYGSKKGRPPKKKSAPKKKKTAAKPSKKAKKSKKAYQGLTWPRKRNLLPSLLAK